ncbi:MAG: hypothetical protein OXU23_16890 [Candidatus Poribacteria bacterium]|nr:hypothetical protein [Candidatus Poribacteria bacterium]
MQQITNTQRTTKGMSSEELASCRKQLERRWKSRKVDEALLEQAWQVVYEIATLLYDEFGATQVAVFGSLTEPMWFSKWSDIDIAVWGLSENAYLDALGKTLGFDPKFKIDLIKFENTDMLFRERILQQACFIKKGETFDIGTILLIETGMSYEMNRKKLAQRIIDERVKIERTVGHIKVALQDIEDAPVRYRRSVEIEIAKYLYDVYMGMETIFRQIAREVDEHIPQGETWHKDLLTQMTAPRAERPPVISQKTAQRLEQFLGFRHVFAHLYSIQLDYEQTEKNAKSIEKLFQDVSKELETFIDSLAQYEEDV